MLLFRLCFNTYFSCHSSRIQEFKGAQAWEFWHQVFLAKKVLLGQGWNKNFKMIFTNFKFIKFKILIHTHMIVVRIGSLHIQLAYLYESSTYDSPTAMNNTHTQIIRVDFLLVRQSDAYTRKTHVFTSPSDVHANHRLRICTHTPIIRKRSHQRSKHSISLDAKKVVHMGDKNLGCRIHKHMISVSMGRSSNFYNFIPHANHMHRNHTSLPIICIGILTLSPLTNGRGVAPSVKCFFNPWPSRLLLHPSERLTGIHMKKDREKAVWGYHVLVLEDDYLVGRLISR